MLKSGNIGVNKALFIFFFHYFNEFYWHVDRGSIRLETHISVKSLAYYFEGTSRKILIQSGIIKRLEPITKIWQHEERKYLSFNFCPIITLSI